MSAWIEGMGWVTPLGASLDEVWDRLQAGERGEIRELKNPSGSKSYACMALPPKITAALERNPRLRRSSTISLVTASAGLAALDHAGLKVSPELAERTALVFAISDGGVIYSRKFYEQIVTAGAKNASPLLFPETVYNAPASHLAALLGLTGSSYTLVGDSSVAISALKFAEQLLGTPEIDHVLVVAGEEIDWVLCEAYSEWHLARRRANAKTGMLLAEGAAAIVVGRRGIARFAQIGNGVPFFAQAEAESAMQRVLKELAPDAAPPLVICSANATFVDAIERRCIEARWPQARRLAPKEQLGDALAAGAAMQVILGATAMEKQQLSHTAVTVLGLNQQASGLILAPG